MNVELIEPETSTEMTVQDRAFRALNSNKTEQDLKALAAKNVGIVAIVDSAGRAQAHGAAMELKTTRVSIEKTSKTARDDANKFSKAVIKEEKRLVAIIQPEETRLLGLRDGWDDEQQRIKEEAERVERARITAIHERISQIRGFHALALECRTSERVEVILNRLLETWLDFNFEDDFEEFGEEAQASYDHTHAAVTAVFHQKLAAETENARIKAEHAAAAAALQAEREAHEAEAKKLADERAAFEADRLAQEAATHADQAAKDLADYHAAITVLVEDVPAAEAPQVSTELFAEPLVLSGEILSIAIEPKAPKAITLIVVIADHFKVTEEQAAEWLDATDFSTYY